MDLRGCCWRSSPSTRRQLRTFCGRPVDGPTGGAVALYELTKTAITALDQTTFATWDINERLDLQRLLKQHVEVIAPDTRVIAEECYEWDESKRRIDLLGVDRDANLVVIELKRTEDGGHMELQALRYAAMVSPMRFAHAVKVYAGYLAK